jgi:hypothetical protein
MVTTASGTQNFKGSLDEIAIYDFVLTAAQVSSIWNSSSGILPSQATTPVIDYIKE